jgi:hypothetical protein
MASAHNHMNHVLTFLVSASLSFGAGIGVYAVNAYTNTQDSDKQIVTKADVSDEYIFTNETAINLGLNIAAR